MNRQTAQSALTLVEMLVVLAIIAGMCALLFPALQKGRGAARRTTCQNNLRQLSIAMRGCVEAHQRVPDKARPNMAGGWAIAILPFMEEVELADQITASSSLTSDPVQRLASMRPAVMRCPSRVDGESNVPQAPVSSYAMATDSARDTWSLGDVPTDFHTAWLISPEMQFSEWLTDRGPH
jgi:prepilin-type N-terminal cleavage/methylation domain-containing protein